MFHFYKPGDISRNLYLASHAYIQGNDPVSGAAAHFLNGCKTAARLVGMSLKCADGKYEVNYSGYNREMMKPLRLKKADVDKHYFTLGLDICQRILWAIEHQDGYFFKDLARLCEGPHPADIDLRQWLILVHWDIDKGTAKGRQQDHFDRSPQRSEINEQWYAATFKRRTPKNIYLQNLQ